MTRILEIDEHISKSLRMDHGNSRWWKSVTFLAHSGDSWFWLIGLGIFWLFFPASRPLTGFLIVAILLLAALVMVIKFTVRRRRPPGEWDIIYRATDPHSFPSGHAARSMMLAVIALQTLPVELALLVMGWATLVCLARVATGMHYISDVLAGTALGISASFALMALRPWMVQVFPILFFLRSP